VPHVLAADAPFDDGEPDTVDDEDVLEDGSEMIIDTQPLLNVHHNGQGASTAPLTGNPVYPPVPPHLVALPVSAQAQPMNPNMFNYVGGHPPYVPQQVRFDEVEAAEPLPNSPIEGYTVDPMDLSSPRPSTSGSGSAAPANPSSHAHPAESSQAPAAGPSLPAASDDDIGSALDQARHQ